jgi:DNA-binding CsgD family transcriptional regulator
LDLDATLGFLSEAAGVSGPHPFPSELLDRLRELVPCEGVFYDELDYAGERVLDYEACSQGREIDASGSDVELGTNFWTLVHQHPICSYQIRTGDLTAHKLSDLVTRRQWHRLELYAEYFRRYGVEHRLAVGLPATPSHAKTLFFDRFGDHDFSERDRLVVNRLRPHLIALDAAARERRLAAGLLSHQEGAGLVVLQPSGAIDFTTPVAARLLARFFGDPPDARLPEPVRAWLRHDFQHLNGNGLPPSPTAPLCLERGERRLTVRRVGRNLLLHEEIATLTRREREIVEQLRKGRSNAEIGEQLTIAPTTVRRHLENIYAKLGVRNRTAAVAAARLEAGGKDADGYTQLPTASSS